MSQSRPFADLGRKPDLPTFKVGMVVGMYARTGKMVRREGHRSRPEYAWQESVVERVGTKYVYARPVGAPESDHYLEKFDKATGKSVADSRFDPVGKEISTPERIAWDRRREAALDYLGDQFGHLVAREWGRGERYDRANRWYGREVELVNMIKSYLGEELI